MARTCQFGCSSISMGTAVTVVTDSRERLNYSVWSYSSPPAVPDPLGLARLLAMAKAVKRGGRKLCSERREALALVKGAPLTRIGAGHCQQANRTCPDGPAPGTGCNGCRLSKRSMAEKRRSWPTEAWCGRLAKRFTCPECWKERARKCVLGSLLRVEGVGGAWHQGPQIEGRKR